MRPFVRRTIQVAAVAGGLWLLGAGVANAGDPLGGQEETSDSTSQTNASASVCDNHVPVAGSHECLSTNDSGSPSGETRDSDPAPQPRPVPETPEPATNGSGEPEVSEPLPAPGAGDSPAPEAQQDPGSDNPVNPTVNAPIEICGNAVAVLEDAAQECSPQGEHATSPDNEADGEDGFLAGNQVNPVINAPITVCGNAVNVLGDGTAECEPSGQGLGSGDGANTGDNTTSGDGGNLSGNIVDPIVNAPVTVCGNAVAVAGDATAICENGGGQGIAPPGNGDGDDGNGSSPGSGNEVTPDVNAPVDVCGNAAGVAGEATAECIQGGGPTPPGPPGPPEGPPEGPDAPDEPGAPAGPGAAAATSGLPTTGIDSAGLALMGLLFMLAGATLVGYGRRRATAVG